MARRETDRDDDAPWLAAATPPVRTNVSRRSLFWTLFTVLALATVVTIGLILLMARKEGGSTDGYMAADQAPIISAEPGPYKIKPADPAGMDIDGLDGTMYTAGEGIDAGSAIDPSLAAETPLPRPGSETGVATAPSAATGVPRELMPPARPDTLQPSIAVATAPPIAVATAPPIAAATAPPAAATAPPAAEPAVPRPVVTVPPTAPKPVVPKVAPAKPVAARPLVVVPVTPEAKPTKSGNVQLGAFSSEEKANAVWAGLAGKNGLTGKRIIAIESGGKTLYRLRTISADPAATCARLKAAGDACAIVE